MANTAEVVQIMGRLGIKGVSRVRCKVLDGHDKDKILTRNVVGPIRIGDVIMLKETSMDAEGKFTKR
jgi:small subunit ribosomal protein S28e